MGKNEGLAYSRKNSKRAFHVSARDLQISQGTRLWKRWSSQGSLVPQMAREKVGRKALFWKKKERNCCFLGDTTKPGGMHEICVWFPKAKKLENFLWKMKSTTVLRKDIFFYRQKWPASTYTNCKKASTCTSHQRDFKDSSQTLYKKSYKSFGPNRFTIIIHLKLLKLRPHAPKLKKTLPAVINTSGAVPRLVRVGISSPEKCQSSAKKNSISKNLMVSKYLADHKTCSIHKHF